MAQRPSPASRRQPSIASMFAKPPGAAGSPGGPTQQQPRQQQPLQQQHQPPSPSLSSASHPAEPSQLSSRRDSSVSHQDGSEPETDDEPSTLGPRHDQSIDLTQVTDDEGAAEEAGDLYPDTTAPSRSPAHGADVPPSPSSVIGATKPTIAAPPSAAQKFMVKALETTLGVLRGSHDSGPLVDDYILTTMDFDKDEDYVNEDFMERKSAIHRHLTLFLQFLMTVAIAFVTAMLMFIVSHSVESLFEFKVDSVLELVEHGEAAGGYFALLALSLLFVTISSAMVAIVAPHARGGGVPYVLAYLNGTNVIEYFSWRIVLVKTISLIFTIAGGLTLGMEGPFVFIGGGVAAILNSATDIVFPFLPSHTSSYAKIIRSIREERIFMAGGMAAGLAVAFDAPIAGVLFALEGATAFLSAPVVLRIFGCAMFASFFNDLGHTNFSSKIRNHNLLEVSNSGTPSPYAWTLLEVFPFFAIALVGGVVGAWATKINMKVSRWRHHYMQEWNWRGITLQMAEVAVFCFITITCWFVLPYIYGCREKHALCDVAVAALPVRCQQAHCGEGMYSEIATIVYATSNQIAALLFDRSLSYEQDFHTAPLITYGVIYWLLVSTIYGAYVPGGLFVPSIVVGGMYGRVIGIACKALFPLSSINPGVYALVGAASMLGGFTRLALPVVIMLVELSGDATYLLPMMFCSVVGKFISDWIEPPLYPQHMKLENIPSLTDKLDPTIAKMQASQIMLPAEKCWTMNTIERLSHVQDVLSKSKRVVFPLITPTGGLAGLILTRNVLYCLSPDAPTYSSYAEAEAQKSVDHGEALREAHNKNKLDWHDDRKDYSATITRGKAEIADVWINFTPYMDAGCMTARPQTPAKRLAALFRRVGLSHLCITDKDNIFRGLVTRRSLITPPGTAPAHDTAHAAQQAHDHADDVHGDPPGSVLAEEQSHFADRLFGNPISPTGGGAYLRAPTFAASSSATSRKNSASTHAPTVGSIQEEQEDGANTTVDERKQHPTSDQRQR